MQQIAQKRKTRGYKLPVFIVLTLLVGFFGAYIPVFATASLTQDFSDSAFPLSSLLLNTTTSGFTNRDSSKTYLSINYAPVKIVSDIAHVNKIKMYFRSTGYSGQSSFCPHNGSGNFSEQMLAGVNLIRIADVTSTYTEALLNLGIDGADISSTSDLPWYSSSGHIIYSLDYDGWVLQADGSCLGNFSGSGGDYIADQINSGWYMLSFQAYGISASTTTSYNNSLDYINNDPNPLSIVGDSSFDTSVLGSNGLYFNNRSDWSSFPLKPSFPYISFDWVAEPILESQYSCNPFVNDISTLFINPIFDLSKCFSGLLTYLFVPSDFVTNEFTGLIDTIKQKPPFGWIVAIDDTLGGLTQSDTPTFVLEQVTPITDNIFDPIRTALSWLLYITFAFYLFNRFKNIII